LRKLNPIREKSMSGHANSAVSCLMVTTRQSFRSWDSEIWPLVKFRSSTNSRRPAGWVSASRTTIHPRYAGIRIHGETYVRARNNSKRKADGRELHTFSEWRGMNERFEAIIGSFFYFCASHPEITRFHNRLESANSESLSVFTRLFPRFLTSGH